MRKDFIKMLPEGKLPSDKKSTAAKLATVVKKTYNAVPDNLYRRKTSKWASTIEVGLKLELDGLKKLKADFKLQGWKQYKESEMYLPKDWEVWKAPEHPKLFIRFGNNEYNGSYPLEVVGPKKAQPFQHSMIEEK